MYTQLIVWKIKLRKKPKITKIAIAISANQGAVIVNTVEIENNNTVYSITDARKDTLEVRKRRYMQLMFLRALMVPGVLILPLPLEIKIPLVALAAVAQFVAVISANTPEQGSTRPETFISDRKEITK